MNCEKCKEQISAYLDNELDDISSANVQEHIAACADCAKVCEDLSMILDFCVEDVEIESEVPPNSKALWRRINNIIETDVKEMKPSPEVVDNRNWFAKLWRNSWQMSFSQVVASFVGIALISSLLTFVAIKNYSAEAEMDSNAATVSESVFQKVLGKIGLVETPAQARARRLAEQQKVIDYWNQRVELRRQNWNGQIRETFDRNLREINQVVYEYNSILEKNPQDNLTGEMLDAAMNEKMDLLRAFSEL
ncbi:MAG: zf-HC2 domain-containing protein [Pyrinomonadaceae bacterium]|nr:zf-HC2 domain-containing protein [Pyrinomonadaceae bacterium]